MAREFGNNDVPKLEDLVDISVLKRLLNSFVLATGLGAIVVDTSGKPILIPESYPGICRFCNMIQSTEEGLRRCADSMARAGKFSAQLGEPYIFRCHAGLIEWAAPILLGERHLGSFMCGQVLMWSLDDGALEEIVARSSDIGLSREQLVEAAKELKIMSGPNVQAAADMLFVMSNYIMETGMLTLMQRKELNEQQAKLAEEIHARKQAEEVLKSLEQRSVQPIYPLEKEKELLGKVRLGDRTGAKEILNELLGSILFESAGRPEVIKARVLELLVVLSRAAVEGGASLEKLLGLNYDYIDELAKIEPIEEMCAWIVKVLDTFIDTVYETRNEKNFKVVERAMEYIRQNYKNDITLEDVANAIFISPYYLSHLFRDELGITFIEYLTKIRIEEASRLLLTTNMSIIRIAEEVGYSDSSYFSKVFKKLQNVTPSQYRQRMS